MNITDTQLAADDGSSLIGHIAAGAGAVARTVRSKLRDTVNAADFGVTPGGSPSANSAALQAAVSAAGRVILPDSEDLILFDDTIDIEAHTQLIGAGAQRTILACSAALAFRYIGPNGFEIEGPRFQDFSLYCAGSGIKLNDAANGYTADGETQVCIMRPRFERVKLFTSGEIEEGTIGIEWNKVFDGVIDQCEIAGFETGYKSFGSDLCEIRGRTRIRNCGTMVDAARTDTFGSGLKLDGCDLLSAEDCYIRSGDHHLMVLNCYLEGASGEMTGPVLDLDFVYMTIFQNNRIEVPAAVAPQFMSLTGEGTLFVFENNYTGGMPWGTIDWNGDNSARYWKNGLRRQKISARNNIDLMPALPFNTIDKPPARNGARDLWVFSPATDGLLPADYGESCRVRNGAFVLPRDAAATTIIRFEDSANPVSGNVNIHVRAYATVAGQELTTLWFNGATPMYLDFQALTTAPAWYTVFSNLNVSDLRLPFLNQDSAHAGEVLIEQIVVERA